MLTPPAESAIHLCRGFYLFSDGQVRRRTVNRESRLPEWVELGHVEGDNVDERLVPAVVRELRAALVAWNRQGE